MPKDMRFTWTYGKDSRKTIFINDNSLPNPKERGIAAIVCNQIGNEFGERLAKAFCRALDMLALLEGLAPLIEAEAEARDKANTHDDYHNEKMRAYHTEMREAFEEISAEIARAHGVEVPEPVEDDEDEDEYEFAPCPHGFALTPCPAGCHAARERSWKR